MMDKEITSQQDRITEPADTLKDDEIIRRVIAGEKDMYSLLVRKYNQRLYRVAISITNDESGIEDLMQTAYIKAYENLGKFRFESGFSTWLTKILINESLMYLKRKERSLSRNSTHTLMEVIPGGLDLQTPLMKVINSELKFILELSIRKLPEKYRTVFIMRELENMSVSETMECLGLTEANIKVRLNRAKVMLREKLKSYINEDELLPFYKPRCNKVVDHVMGIILKETTE